MGLWCDFESCWWTWMWSGGGGALPMGSLALGVTFRQTLQSFPFLEDFHKNAKQGLLFFPVNFGFGKCKHLSYSIPICLFIFKFETKFKFFFFMACRILVPWPGIEPCALLQWEPGMYQGSPCLFKLREERSTKGIAACRTWEGNLLKWNIKVWSMSPGNFLKGGYSCPSFTDMVDLSRLRRRVRIWT